MDFAVKRLPIGIEFFDEMIDPVEKSGQDKRSGKKQPDSEKQLDGSVLTLTSPASLRRPFLPLL